MLFRLGFKQFCILSLVAISCISTSLAKRHEIKLDNRYTFAWQVFQENGTIQLEAEGETMGYVGLGINHKGKMNHAEMAIGGIHEGGQSYHGVYMGHKHKVKLDRKRKWTLLEARRNDTHTYLKYERPLGTKDAGIDGLPNYIPIKDKDIHIIWALGKSDKLKKHSVHGKVKVNLINPHKDHIQYFNQGVFDLTVDF